MRFPTDRYRLRVVFAILLVAVAVGILGSAVYAQRQRAAVPDPYPLALYLTWQRDPTTTMTVCWQVRENGPHAQRANQLEYQSLSDAGWTTVNGTHRRMAHSDRQIRQAEITGLKPGTIYRFRFSGDPKIRRFRTLPATLDQPVRFAVGGDTMHQKAWWEATNRQVVKHDPDFILLGGDLFYEDGKPEQVRRVYDWLDGYRNTMVAANDRVVPVVVAIGNHEVRGGNAKTPEEAPFFYSLFPFPGRPGYNVLDVGNYMSIFSLDSGHTNPIDGKQTEWLSRALAERSNRTHLFPIYHVPAYPSVRPFTGGASARIRQHWVPLFEKHGVRTAFENHDHAYKRSHPIRGGKIDRENGITFVGDGAWGTTPRPVHKSAWYLAKAESVRHFVLVTLHPSEQRYQAITDQGRVIDEFRVPVRR